MPPAHPWAPRLPLLPPPALSGTSQARSLRGGFARPQTRTMVATTAPAEAAAPVVIHRKDYTPTPYLVDTVDLAFDLNEDVTTVTSKLAMTPNYKAGPPPPLVLNGRKDLRLVSLKIITAIKPQENTDLEGLYKSSGNYCTQCEAEGFRGITYFLDRPDVMANGDAPNGRHFAVWEDPWVKPCYLFALVAGDLQVKEDSFTTASGRKVLLRIYTQPQYIDQVDFAMVSLKKSMKWDEEVYGLEYDLDLFNIVAVDDFNMGAMENKSLNIFNSRLVLATPDSSSDGDYARIEGVVAHEYFHNWTGAARLRILVKCIIYTCPGPCESTARCLLLRVRMRVVVAHEYFHNWTSAAIHDLNSEMN
ncbi:MAG: putative aminopeptidase, 3 [Monoraphidium minutum]|nr:MAG: putative aminopeptidase, 3 [Monoraphidium minutum]